MTKSHQLYLEPGGSINIETTAEQWRRIEDLAAEFGVTDVNTFTDNLATILEDLNIYFSPDD